MSTLEKNLEYEREIERLNKELDNVNSLYKKTIDDLGKTNTMHHNLSVKMKEKDNEIDNLIKDRNNWKSAYRNLSKKNRWESCQSEPSGVSAITISENLKMAYERNRKLSNEIFDKNTEIRELRASYKLREDVIRKLQTQLTESQDNIEKRDVVIRDLREKLCNRQFGAVNDVKGPLLPTKGEPYNEFEFELRDDMVAIHDMLVKKNRSYGNSALDPVRIFSKATSIEQILVRIDDKLSRLKRGTEYPGDDTIRDLIGYLFLLLQAKRSSEQQSEEPI